MKNKLKELCAMVSGERYETMLLLYLNYCGKVVISADTSSEIKYYVLWDATEGSKEILAIYSGGGKIDEEKLKKEYPEYDEHIATEQSEEEKITLLDWMYSEDEERLPPNLGEIKNKVNTLSEVFAYPFGTSIYDWLEEKFGLICKGEIHEK